MPGLIAQSAPWELTVSASNGEAVYLLRDTSTRPAQVIAAATSRAEMARLCAVVLFDVPQGIVDAVDALPDDPAAVLRPERAKRSSRKTVAEWRIVPNLPDQAPQRLGPDPRDLLRGPRQAAFYQAEPFYHGVLVEAGDHRFAVSPNGKRYLWQARCADGSWAVERWRKTLSALRAVVDLPKAAEAYPDDPRNVHRPWAEQAAEDAARLAAVNTSRDGYAGAIATDGALRVVVLPLGLQYALQIWSRSHGWQVRRYADTAAELSAVVVGTGQPWPDAGGLLVRSDVLAEAVAGLPADPRDHTAAPERATGAAQGLWA